MMMMVIVMLMMSVVALLPAVTVIEQVCTPMGDRCRRRRTVVAVAVFHGAKSCSIERCWTASS
jgi:hypothetical protein